MKILRQELQNLQPQGGHCRMEVSRDEIFEVRTMQKEIHLFSSPDPKASPDTILKLDTLVMIQTKFGFHWSSTFRGEDF
jgi:hypothetical protein